MPTYSYQCTECDNRFDIVQAFTDDALTTCERCSGRLRKRFNSVGVVFKGSGFYRTDSRESAKTSTNGSSKSDAGSGEKSGSSEKPASSDKSASGDKSGSGEKSGTSSTASTAAATG